MKFLSLYTVLLCLLIISPCIADIYSYHTPDGKIVFSNTPPVKDNPAKRHKEAEPPRAGVDAPVSQPLTSPDVNLDTSHPRRYVDNHPLAIMKSDIRNGDKWWNPHVVGTIENRSNLTVATEVKVTAACYAKGGQFLKGSSTSLGSVAPRSTRHFNISIILSLKRPPKGLNCKTRVTWRNADSAIVLAEPKKQLRGIGPVRVRAYKRSDGTQVRAHERSRPSR